MHEPLTDRAAGRGRRALLRRGSAPALCLLLGAALAACSGGGGDGDATQSVADSSPPAASSPAASPSTPPGAKESSPPATQSSSPSGPDTPAASGTTKPSAAPTSKKAAAADRCPSAGMRLELGRGDTGAGNVHYSLVFTNTSGRSCTLSGYPGVSLLAGDGQQIGAPATREGGGGGGVRLAPGARAYSVVHTLNEGINGGCRPSGKLLRVYPPGSREAMTTRSGTFRVCGDTFTVTSLKPGAGPS
ncbi:DUF4232 domain-containing protein [Streptomyces sp. NPDC007088]|uniref:DUF4232 domain-containing protein n=1 Tax=Streptomyces sp. NPDC007088 TaxID=3364773 RepID=UPI00367D28E3